MNQWIAEFELEDGDTMPEHMDLNYKGAKIDFHCRPMWIPVSEKLPEDGTYFVTIKSSFGGEPMVGIRAFAKDLNKVNEFDFPKHKYGWYDYDGEYGFWEETMVIAWMPLPKQYKTESKVEE